MRAAALLGAALSVAGCSDLRAGCEPGQTFSRQLSACVDVAPDGSSRDVPQLDAAVSCPAGLELCGGFCRDTQTDERHCGACGNACTSVQVCASGRCRAVVGCEPPRMMCGDACVDTSSDERHCGACNTACPAGSACSSGRCACPLGQAFCAGACINVATDEANCGACGNRCGDMQVCFGGRCFAAPGSPCARDNDCPGGACAPAAQGFPGGYCVYACAATAQAGTACTSAGVCSGPGDQNLCFRRCSPGASGGCRQGYVCLDITGGGTVGVCYPNCTSNPGLLCGAYRCNATTGACGGGRCTDSARCSPGSYCGVLSARCECTAATSCGPNHRCYVFVTGSRCGCANDAGCGPGRTCNTNNGTCQ